MKRRDFMLAVGACAALALTKTKAQESVRRPRLLISSTDPFTGLAFLKIRLRGRYATLRRHGRVGAVVATHGRHGFR